MRQRGELLPLRAAVQDGRAAAEARMEARVRKAWPFIVGPALVPHTRLLRVRHQTLVVGCWTTEVISNLRQSAEATWPQLQARLERLLGLKLRHLEIVPCDPPEPSPVKDPVADPLAAVLQRFRSFHKQDWTSGWK